MFPIYEELRGVKSFLVYTEKICPSLSLLRSVIYWRFLGLKVTLLSGYADDLFNTLFRTDAKRMIEDGHEWGSAGRERFTRDFGVIETIERITVEDNACSKKTNARWFRAVQPSAFSPSRRRFDIMMEWPAEQMSKAYKIRES